MVKLNEYSWSIVVKAYNEGLKWKYGSDGFISDIIELFEDLFIVIFKEKCLYRLFYDNNGLWKWNQRYTNML